MNKSGLDLLLNRVSKKYGILVYSGTIAAEAALRCLNVKRGDKVLVSSSICYSIIESILRVGAIPVLVVSKDYYEISALEIASVIKKEKNIKCIFLAHQYGIAQDIKSIKEEIPNIPIIEDIAQAWSILVSGECPGLYSDILITSFGKTKPLSLGFGGAIFSNKDYSYLFDFYDNKSRESEYLLMPYTINIEYKIIAKIIKNGDKIVHHQREIAKLLTSCFANIEGVTIHIDRFGSNSVWHRFPIIIDDKKTFDKIIKLLEKNNIEYQLPHKKELFELPIVQNSDTIVYRSNYRERNVILIRTRTNKKENIIKLKRSMKNE